MNCSTARHVSAVGTLQYRWQECFRRAPQHAPSWQAVLDDWLAGGPVDGVSPAQAALVALLSLPWPQQAAYVQDGRLVMDRGYRQVLTQLCLDPSIHWNGGAWISTDPVIAGQSLHVFGLQPTSIGARADVLWTGLLALALRTRKPTEVAQALVQAGAPSLSPHSLRTTTHLKDTSAWLLLRHLSGCPEGWECVTLFSQTLSLTVAEEIDSLNTLASRANLRMVSGSTMEAVHWKTGLEHAVRRWHQEAHSPTQPMAPLFEQALQRLARIGAQAQTAGSAEAFCLTLLEQLQSQRTLEQSLPMAPGSAGRVRL